MIYHARVDGFEFEVEVGPDGVLVDGQPVEVDLGPPGSSATRSLILDGVSFRGTVRRVERGRWAVGSAGRAVEVRVLDARELAVAELTGGIDSGPGGGELHAPMPGLVVRVEVEEGAPVRRGQGLLIVEAMKMENELAAPADGRVRTVHVAAGDTVERDQLLVEIDRDEESA